MSQSPAEHDEKTVVVAATAMDEPRATLLAAELRLESAGEDWRTHANFALRVEGDHLSLVDRESKDRDGISSAFPAIPVRHGRIAVSRAEPLGRAFGSRVRTIVDATAGLGHDSFLLACMGFDVTAVERSPIVAALLHNGVERAMRDGRVRNAIEGRLRIFTGEACAALQSAHEKPDAVYLDPMFRPRRKKSALAKKAIRMVRSIVGSDEDAADVLTCALENVNERVVVKRLDDAPPLMPGPVASIRGNTVRYDVYHARQAAGRLHIPGE